METLEIVGIVSSIICVSLYGNAVFVLLVHQLFATEKKTELLVLKEGVSEEVIEEGCSTLSLEAYATKQAISFYENVGLWADVFTIGSVLKTRVELVHSEQFVLHMRYFYVPVPDNKESRADVGTDQRTFHFICRENWVLERMGGHMSAEFPS